MTALLPLLIAFWQFGGSGPSPTAASLGLVIGTNVQAYDATLTAYAAQDGAANKLAYFNGANDILTTDFTAAARTLVAAETASAQRSALGLGSTDSVDHLVITANAALVNYGGFTGYANPITFGSHPYTILAADYWILCDPAGGNTTINLPEPGTAAAYAGRIYCAKKYTSNGNKCVLDTPGAHTIDGAASIDLDVDYELRCVMSTGSNWSTIATGTGP